MVARSLNRIDRVASSDSASTKPLTVIIPAYDDTPLLRRAIWAVKSTAHHPFELLVRPSKVQSVAENRNDCLDRTSTDLVAFLDDDVLLPAHWMSRMMAILTRDRTIGAVSAFLQFPDGSPQTRRERLGEDELWDVPIPGTCFIYSRSRVGDLRFDPRFRGSQWEDTDWIWRVREQSLRTVMTGAVVVVHEHRMTQNDWLEHNRKEFREKWGRLPDSGETCAISPEQYRSWKAPALETLLHEESASPRSPRG